MHRSAPAYSSQYELKYSLGCHTQQWFLRRNVLNPLRLRSFPSNTISIILSAIYSRTRIDSEIVQMSGCLFLQAVLSVVGALIKGGRRYLSLMLVPLHTLLQSIPNGSGSAEN